MTTAVQSNVPKCMAAARNFSGVAGLILLPILVAVFMIVRQVEIQSMDSDLLYTTSIILAQFHAIGEHSSVGKALSDYAHPATDPSKSRADEDDGGDTGDGSPVNYVATMGFDPDEDDVPPDNTLYTRLTNADGTTATVSPTLRSQPAIVAVLTALHPEHLPEGWAGFAGGGNCVRLRVMSFSLHTYHLQCARQWVEPAAFLVLVAKILTAIFAAGVAMAGALGYSVAAASLRPIGEVIDVEAKRREVLAAEKLVVENAKVTRRKLVEQPSLETKQAVQPAPEPLHRTLIDEPEEQQQQVLGRMPPDI